MCIRDSTLTQQANQELTQPINWSNYTPLASTPQSADAYANQAGNAAYQQYINRNQPLQQIALNQQQTQLENQGLKPVSYTHLDVYKRQQ